MKFILYHYPLFIPYVQGLLDYTFCSNKSFLFLWPLAIYVKSNSSSNQRETELHSELYLSHIYTMKENKHLYLHFHPSPLVCVWTSCSSWKKIPTFWGKFWQFLSISILSSQFWCSNWCDVFPLVLPMKNLYFHQQKLLGIIPPYLSLTWWSVYLTYNVPLGFVRLLCHGFGPSLFT